MNSFIIVILFLALSQVTWPTFNRCVVSVTTRVSISMCVNSCVAMHLVFNPHVLDDLEQSLSKMFTDMCIVDAMQPISALLSSHSFGVNALIQCAVTAKYPSVLLACHPSHVKLMRPWTANEEYVGNEVCQLMSRKLLH